MTIARTASPAKMSSTELGALWMTYHKKTMILRMLEYFIAKADDKKAKELMSGLWKQLDAKVTEMKVMLENEGAAVPDGFTKEDCSIGAPALFENGFDIMFCRILKEISMGMYVLHLTISYREDIVLLYKQLTDITQTYYNHFTQFLSDKALLPRPTYVSMPQSTDYITDKQYMKGTGLFGHKRPLNTVEFGLLYHGFETNITGMQLMSGFAQCAKDEAVRNYFAKGKALSKEILKDIGDILLQNDIQPPATPGGTVTGSTEAPFSDKLMLYCVYLLGSFSLGGQGFSTAFNLRNDVVAVSAKQAKDVFEYAREAATIMMEKGWMEEPPRMDV
ncbi:DUF3231 family protein [Paenibacillus arenilitoris]|uniref:DUF3231 family protein n=1 Tax=Paenibacillus arenilitoris TaxID=2772299 RepID=A0A927CKE2_9BACL|nr:DUF3231 family protein [Paenibacillus arenilitoris]MBD2868782.1 DUF3231 family protein [Paenibacillus arenilitoris]